MEDADMHTTASAGRGRGRGRGGEAVLPQGLWDELSGLGAEKDTSDAHKDHDHVRRDYPNPGQFDDGDACMPPAGFGRGRGGMGGGRGRGPEKDMKGPDWACPSCANVNWSWRASCNKCNTAKPMSVLAEPKEVRDGAGGGFNERQGRVSAANVEITADGFDDFGRRAKGRAEDKKAKEAAALARLQSNYGFLLNPESMAEFVNANKANESSAAHAAPDKRPEGKKRSRSRSRSRDRRNHERSRGDGRDRNEDRYRDGGDARDRHSGADRRRDFDYDKGKAGHRHRQHGGDHDRRR